MPSPYLFKRGWDREKLAEYILSRFSFVTKPSTISDEIGGDFYCTLFRLEKKCGLDYPFPLSSFAIQIKSSDIPYDFSAHIDYLQNLEIPFFWGVLDERIKQLSIYSGENLPSFFSHVGRVEKLRIKPIVRDQMSALYIPPQPRKYKYAVMFPKILDINLNSTRKELKVCVYRLHKMCSLMHRNISTRKTEEYLFERYDSGLVDILAGKGSAKKFRKNFMKRLAENFYNLKWIYDNCPKKKKLFIEKNL